MGMGGLSMGEKWGYLQKRELFLKQKNNISGGFSESIEILFVFWRVFGEF